MEHPGQRGPRLRRAHQAPPAQTGIDGPSPENLGGFRLRGRGIAAGSVLACRSSVLGPRLPPGDETVRRAAVGLGFGWRRGEGGAITCSAMN